VVLRRRGNILAFVFQVEANNSEFLRYIGDALMLMLVFHW